MIEISKGFQSSVNIEYDFNSESKINSFIPTRACLDIIDSIISSTESGSTLRAKILTGAYGRGKSLCVLIALSILFNSDKKKFSALIKKIKAADEILYKKINNYLTGKKRLLPVIINGNSGNMTQAFLSGLQNALNSYDMNDIMPETFFDSAVKTIERWQNDYPETYGKMAEMLDCSVSDFVDRLLSNDIEAYHNFIDIHPALTSGSIFNPFVGSNVVDIYDNVNTEIKRKGYSGIFVVYDEFGKYLESNIATSSESETKMLQDFAEKCNREASQQLHLLLICHKDISNYIDLNLPQDKVDGWRGISGRFEHINLTNNFSQMYEIISHTVVKKETEWNHFYTANQEVFESLISTYEKTNLLSGKTRQVIFDCYPLHPVTTFVLPRLSEKVAQNERTLFTFLSSTQKNTLKQFIDKNTSDIPFVTPDYLYDYFENELRKELNTSDIYKVYALSAKILRKFKSDSLSAKIIKTISVIHFIQQFEKLAPTIDNIANIFSIEYGSKEVSDCITELIEEKYILYRKTSNEYLYLKETSGVDINAEIHKRVDAIKATKSVIDIINGCISTKYLYPVAYNDDHCITRYFELKFVTADKYTDIISQPLPNELSGCVYAVLFPDSISYETEKSAFLDLTSNNPRHITIIPNGVFIDPVKTLSDYLSIKELREEAEGDQLLFDEYTLYLDDYSDIVSDFVLSYISPELNRAKYYYKGNEIKIRRKSQLSGLLTDICCSIYDKTPIINNESINKDDIPSVAVNSRTKIINALIENDIIEENLSLKGTGQDVSFMRSTLIQTGILKNDDNRYYLELSPDDDNLAFVLNEIKAFFQDTIINGEKKFDILYKKLTDPQYGIGLKRGVIPIYISVVLHQIKKDLIFKNDGHEIKLTADLINSINEKPEIYSVLMEDWNEEKAEYLQALQNIFKDYIIEKEKSFNSFSYIYLAINRWYLSLPKCSRDMNRYYDSDTAIEKMKMKFIQSLKAPIVNTREYLMETIKSIYGFENVNINLADSVRVTKKIFDSGKDKLIICILNMLKTVFGGNEGSSVTSALKDWYGRLDGHTTEHLFANNENYLLKLISTITNDEVTFAQRIGKAITGLRIDDWNNNTVKSFCDGLKKFKQTVEEYDRNREIEIDNRNRTVQIIVTDENGANKIRSFEAAEYSERANLLYQDITAAIEEMGQSITEQEKRQVLIDILTKLCD